MWSLQEAASWACESGTLVLADDDHIVVDQEFMVDVWGCAAYCSGRNIKTKSLD